MRILILGGTRFAGRAIVEAALGRGDSVTMFNRGQSGPRLYPGAETVIGDRTKDLSPLDGREFDAVIDVACYDPEAARVSAPAFAQRAGGTYSCPPCRLREPGDDRGTGRGLAACRAQARLDRLRENYGATRRCASR